MTFDRKQNAQELLNLHPRFITNLDGKKEAVVLDFKEYRELVEDYQDLLAMLEAKKETPISLEEAEKILKQDGLL